MYYMANDFTVVKRTEDGKIYEHKFTSHAQARQFMEQNAGQAPLAPHKPMRPGESLKAGHISKPIASKTAEQRQLAAKALEMFKGL